MNQPRSSRPMNGDSPREQGLKWAAFGAGLFALVALVLVIKGQQPDEEPSGALVPQDRGGARRFAVENVGDSEEQPAPPRSAAAKTVDRKDKEAVETLLRAYAASVEAEGQPSEGGAAVKTQEEYRWLRAPLISAVRRFDLPSEERHEAMAEALEDSGPSSEPWTEAFSNVYATWQDAMPEGIVPESGQPQCYLAGCVLPVSFKSMEAFKAASAVFRRLDDRNLAHGGRMLLPPRENDAGAIESGWIMLPPKPNAEAP